jgi:Kef-type K+ transport system membrane component KefB
VDGVRTSARHAAWLTARCSVCGRIPGFTAAIFPQQSIPLLSLVANIGLVFFLFLIGLEVDVRIIKKCAVASTAISLSGLILPFGLGAAVSWGLYNEFIDTSRVSFNHFLLFTGTAFSITALPVLARILGSLGMLQSKVGTIVLAAGVGNDVIGWVLLALTVALVNAQTGLTALYVLLTTIAWCLVLFFLIRPVFLWLCRRTGSFEKGPTALMLTITILLMFTSAFLTDIIGVHAIFGAFLVGLIIPHEGGFAVALTEKIEDLVLTTMLPLYFALSGLKTQLGTLNSGITWAYTIAIIVVAFVSKFAGCAGAAKVCGFSLRESGAIGALMSCKGLVELIVLNIGLQAGILDTRSFSMFVVMALVSTFITTPLTQLIYPARFRLAEKDGSVHGHEGDDCEEEKSGDGALSRASRHLMVVLDGFEHLPGLLTLMQLMRPSDATLPASESSESNLRHRNVSGSDGESIKESSSSSAGGHPATHELRQGAPYQSASAGRPEVTVSALRLIELTERTSAVMRVAEAEDTLRADPIINVFRTFGQLNHLPVYSSMAVVDASEYAPTVVSRASGASSSLLVVPWTVPQGSIAAPTGEASGALPASAPAAAGVFSTISNPFDSIFGPGADGPTRSPQNINFVRRVFQTATCDVGLLVERPVGTRSTGPLGISRRQHVVLAFMGGPDDRAALALVLALCRANRELLVTVLHFKRVAADEAGDAPLPDLPPTVHHAQSLQHGAGGVQDTMYPTIHGAAPLEATLEDNLSIKNATDAAAGALAGRLTVKLTATSRPLRDFVQAVDAAEPTLVVCGRGRRMPTMTHREELRFLLRCGMVDPTAADLSAPPTRDGERALSSETCKVIGEPAMAVTRFAKASAACLVVAAPMRKAPATSA